MVPLSLKDGRWLGSYRTLEITKMQMFLLDILDNLPRLHISNPLMRVFLWILKQSGAQDVPSFDRLRKMQQDLRKQCGIPTSPHKSVQGNIFYMNDPRTLIAKVTPLPILYKDINSSDL
jgi:hypothetical protein